MAFGVLGLRSAYVILGSGVWDLGHKTQDLKSYEGFG